MRQSALGLLVFAFLAACGQTIPTFPPVPYDSGIECTSSSSPPAMDGSVAPHDGGGSTRSCATGQVCISGHCYAPCTMDAQCGDNEMCAMGVCTARGGPHDGGPDTGPVDGGPVDSGPTDPCAHVTCSDVAAPACNPVTATCVQCAATDGCMSAAAPVCDLAQGVCRPFVASICAPCKVNADCMGIIAGMTFECAMHMAPSPFEKVCLPLCGAAMACPYGMQCDTDGVHCVPRLGTCTHWFAAAGSRTCMTDADCAPLGATSADFLFANVCSGGHCAQPCGLATDCQTMTQTCPSGTICM